MERRTSFTNDMKRSTERTFGLSRADPPARMSSSNCSTNSKARATTSDDQSSLPKPGITRRSGFTAQSVSAMVNCAMGLREGARRACIQKRTRAARMKRLKSVSRTRTRAWLITSVLSQRSAQLARALAGRAHRRDEMLLHLRRIEDFQRALRGTALGGDLRAQRGRILAALDGELGRADEGPQRER